MMAECVRRDSARSSGSENRAALSSTISRRNNRVFVGFAPTAPSSLLDARANLHGHPLRARASVTQDRVATAIYCDPDPADAPWNAVSAFAKLRTCRRTRPGQLCAIPPRPTDRSRDRWLNHNETHGPMDTCGDEDRGACRNRVGGAVSAAVVPPDDPGLPLVLPPPHQHSHRRRYPSGARRRRCRSGLPSFADLATQTTFGPSCVRLQASGLDAGGARRSHGP